VPVLNPDSHPWSLVSIRAHTPNGSGVYGIFGDTWIYVGDGDDIQRCLLGHFMGDIGCIMEHRPRGFTFELVPVAERRQRCAELIAELHPLCNGRLVINPQRGGY
jgi:hypothetical protein